MSHVSGRFSHVTEARRCDACEKKKAATWFCKHCKQTTCATCQPSAKKVPTSCGHCDEGRR